VANINCQHCGNESDLSDERIRSAETQLNKDIARVRSKDWEKFKIDHSRKLFRFKIWEFLSIFQFLVVLLFFSSFNGKGVMTPVEVLLFFISAVIGVVSPGRFERKKEAMFQAWRNEYPFDKKNSDNWEGVIKEDHVI